ncbi:hypothetical protein [Brevifollis gellanilyticus]|uniref:DUF5666 domain-containing protein n=1 Tax=Brevifollis gellanilyticus TaxID=748831 RepID=A0A512M685_9BACT|nr:hypothetical protein [Brevifollis gellanilyticus]GEP42256.1 hypothetical protein BGE01nite_15470 [Brevifollis gellanilyticus]
MNCTSVSRLLGTLLLLLSSSLSAVEQTFPKLTDAQRMHGELVNVDFIRRAGQFRTDKGELVDFTMPPYAIMKYRGSEADLREVPLGAKMDFLVLPGETDRPVKLITTDDGETKPDAELQKKFREFTEKRGVAGWITKTEGKAVTVALFSGDPAFYEAAYGQLLVKGKTTKTCVANDELRTWNPGVDGENGAVLEVQKLPVDGFGFSGYQVTLSVSNMLEGFRKGRVVRVFLQGWKAQDQYYGESLMGYGFGRLLNQELVQNVAKEYPEQFPFRTDYSNEHLPWYQLKEGVKAPPFSEHLVFGELVSADAKTGTGQFLAERTGEAVNFTLIKKHTVKHLGKDTQLVKLPTGQRYRFHCYQDDKGAFTRVTIISDEVSHLMANATTGRVAAIHPDRLHIAWQLPMVKDYNGDMQRPQDIAQRILPVSEATKVWKGDKAMTLGDLKVGDDVRVNLTAELPNKRLSCAEVWLVEAPVK